MTTPAPKDKQLPPLPEPPCWYFDVVTREHVGYTADQMNAHYLKGYEDGQRDAREWRPMSEVPIGEPFAMIVEATATLNESGDHVMRGTWYDVGETLGWLPMPPMPKE